jgi:hypothetical protein
MYPYVIKAHYWDNYTEPPAREHIQVLLYASSAAEAVRQFEDSNYVNDIEDIKVTCVGDKGQFFEVPGHIATILIEGLGIYRDGLVTLETNEKIAKKLHDDAKQLEPKKTIIENASYVAPGTIAPWAEPNEEE